MADLLFLPNRRPSPLVWDIGIALVGLVLMGLTWSWYPVYTLSFPSHSQSLLSSAEADLQIGSAKIDLQKHPDDFSALATLAMAYYQKGPDFYIDGLNALEKARSYGATDPRLFFYAGVMYNAVGLPEYAINEFSKHRRHYPQDYETLVRLANIYFHQKQYDAAEALYKETLHHWSKDPTVLFNFAIVNKEKGQYPLALTYMSQVRRIAGDLPPGGLFEEGEIYRLQGDLDHALNDFHQELARQPDELPALQALEFVARQKGDLKTAREVHKHINDLKKNPAVPSSAPAGKGTP